MTNLIVVLAVLLYQFAVWALLIGGAAYVVFVLHRSPWWFALAVLLGCIISSIEFSVNGR